MIDIEEPRLSSLFSSTFFYLLLRIQAAQRQERGIFLWRLYSGSMHVSRVHGLSAAFGADIYLMLTDCSFLCVFFLLFSYQHVTATRSIFSRVCISRSFRSGFDQAIGDIQAAYTGTGADH
jgi:hypothetical protein